MAKPEFKQVIKIEGCEEEFNTKAEAMEWIRRPQILAALMKVTSDQKDLADFLLDNQDAVISAFDAGTIRRISKADQKKIDKGFERMAELLEAGDKAFQFLVENSDNLAIKYKPQPRLKDDQKELQAKNTLMAASENNEKLADWVIANETKILEAYDAGKEKRVVSPKAEKGLAAYRAGKTEEKRLIEEEGMDPKEAELAGQALTEKLKAEYADA